MRQLDLFGAAEKNKANSTREGPVNADSFEEVAINAEEENVLESNNNESGEDINTKEGEVEAIEKTQEVASEKKSKPASKRGRKSFKEMDAEMVHVEIPPDETLFKKQYYAISEVAEWFHVNTSLLRFWENEFDILKPRKTRKGDRLFRPEDIKNLQLIYFLLRQRKFSMEGAKQYLKENKQKADLQMQLITSLTKLKAFFLEWKANLGT
jgi:DNA-binding transcriptional MerR regulator